MNDKELSFEEAVERINGIIRELESGELTLEESINAYENAIGIISACRKQLDGFHRKIEVLKKSGGETVISEMDDDFA